MIYGLRFGLYKISIHAAREGGDLCQKRIFHSGRISIHAAREGGDDQQAAPFAKEEIFQSTPPVKAATTRLVNNKFASIISIHAAREGGDHIVFGVAVALGDISIHAAREGGDPGRLHL